MRMSISRLRDRATKLLEKHEDAHRSNIVCFILDKQGRVISTGYNSMLKTSTKQGQLAIKCGEPERKYRHAEVHAVSKAKWIKSKAHAIFVVRKLRNSDSLALAKPCQICDMAIRELENVRFLIYSNTEGHITFEKNIR